MRRCAFGIFNSVGENNPPDRLRQRTNLLEKLRPVIYDEEQLRYLSLGEKVADAFRTGAELKKRLEGA